MRVKIGTEVIIKATGQSGTVISKNGKIIHVQTPQKEIIKTETNLVRVLSLAAQILASIIKIIGYFK